MNYDERRGNGWAYGQRGGRGYAQQGSRDNRTNAVPEQSKPIEPKPVPLDYVDEAERVMNALKTDGNGQIQVTTSKIRSIHALSIDIYNKENLRREDELLPDSRLKLMRMRVHIVYDAGREPKVKAFVQKAHLLEYIKGIGNSRTAMIRFAHYMEALVAYHRFLGGKEN